MLDREEAVSLLQSKGLEENLIAHCLQTEAVLRHLADRLGQDPHLWGITGLLHDLDYPGTKDDAASHGLETARELDGKLPEEALQAIKAHNSEENGAVPANEFDFALRCGESVTGLVSANALVRPQGMEGMKPSSLKKKMKDKSFAANVSRERIRECEKLGLDLDEFLRIGIEALGGIADQPESGLGAGQE
jgi:putative nucleotidyltransferase with HDIG domain